MKLIKQLRMLVLIFGIIFYSSCSKTNKSDLNMKTNAYYNQKLTLFEKKINSLSEIIGDTVDIANKAVFIYCGYDCETCIEKGYMFASKLDNLKRKQSVFIVSTSANIAKDQIKSAYQNFVYKDEHDLIRKELKYIYTPVFLLFGSDKKITSVYFPGIDSIDDENKFLEECKFD